MPKSQRVNPVSCYRRKILAVAENDCYIIWNSNGSRCTVYFNKNFKYCTLLLITVSNSFPVHRNCMVTTERSFY